MGKVLRSKECFEHPFWGKMDGQFVPRDLLESKKCLGISEGELLLILFVMKYQFGNSKPFPSDSHVAEQMGISRRSVLRRKKSLRDKGLLKLIHRYRGDGGRTSNVWDFGPLQEHVEVVTSPRKKGSVPRTSEPKVSHPPVTPVAQPPVTPASQQEVNQERRKKEKKLRALRAASLSSGKISKDSEGGPVREENLGELIYLFSPEKETSSAVGKINTGSIEIEEETSGMGIKEKHEILLKAEAEAKAKARACRAAKEKREAAKARWRENLEGDGGGSSVSTRKQLKKLEAMWTEGIREMLPDVTVAAWGGKERGQARQLLEKYDGNIVETGVDYVLREWDSIRDRFLRGRGVVPTLGFLLKFHDSLIIEAQLWNEFRKAELEWKEFFRKNPGSLYPPADLEKKYKAAKKKFEALGL